MRLLAYIFISLAMTAQFCFADGPVVWNGSTVKWLPSALRSAGIPRISVGGAMSLYTTDGIIKMTTGVPGAAVAGTDYQAPISLAAFGATPNANGLTFSANTLNMQPADATNPGGVSTGAQTIAGAKTFSSAPTLSTMTLGSVLFAGTAGIVSQDNANLFWDDTNNNLNIAGAVGNAGVLGSLNLKARSDSLGQHIQLEGPGTNGNRFLYINQRENGDMFFYNPGLGRVLIDYNASANSFAIGQTGGNFQFQVTASQPDTTPITPTAIGSMAISNSDTTNGNYSGLLFQGSQSSLSPDSAVYGIHDVHSGASSSGSLEFWTRNAGTLARAARIAPDKAVTLDAYGTGLLHSSSAGVITSSAVNLASADVTGILPNANTTATAAAGNSTIVARDGSGNFAAGTITAALTGTASGNEVPLTFSTGLTRSTNTITVNTSQNISTLSNLTSNGLVTTSGGTGALSVTATTGSGNVVLATSPTIVTPTIAKLANLTTNGFVKTGSGDGTLSVQTSPIPSADINAGRTINAQTGTTYTFVLADGSGAGGHPLVTSSNAAAQTVTVPPNSSVAFPVGTQIDICQLGAGKMTLAQGAGVTINSKASNKAAGAQYVCLSLFKTATDTWVLIGDLIARAFDIFRFRNHA